MPSPIEPLDDPADDLRRLQLVSIDGARTPRPRYLPAISLPDLSRRCCSPGRPRAADALLLVSIAADDLHRLQLVDRCVQHEPPSMPAGDLPAVLRDNLSGAVPPPP